MNFLTQVVESHNPSVAYVICEWNFSAVVFTVILSKDFLPQSTDASDTQIFILMKKKKKHCLSKQDKRKKYVYITLSKYALAQNGFKISSHKLKKTENL